MNRHTRNVDRDRARELARAHKLARELAQALARSRSRVRTCDRNVDLARYHYLELAPPCDIDHARIRARACDHARVRASACDHALDLARELTHDLAIARVIARARDVDLSRARELERDLVRSRALTRSQSRSLVRALERACEIEHGLRASAQEGVTDSASSAPGRVSRGLVALAARVLPAYARPRYREEFGVELVELPRREQLRYALRVLTRAWELRRALTGAVRTRDGAPVRRVTKW